MLEARLEEQEQEYWRMRACSEEPELPAVVTPPLDTGPEAEAFVDWVWATFGPKP